MNSKGKINIGAVLVIVVVIAVIAAILLVGGKNTSSTPTDNDVGPADTNSVGNQSPQEVLKTLPVFQEAVKKQDLSLCAQVSGAENQQKCQEEIFFGGSQTKTDVTVCEKFGEGSLYAKCRASVFTHRAVEAKDPDLCSQITNDVDLREQCVQEATLQG